MYKLTLGALTALSNLQPTLKKNSYFSRISIADCEMQTGLRIILTIKFENL